MFRTLEPHVLTRRSANKPLSTSRVEDTPRTSYHSHSHIMRFENMRPSRIDIMFILQCQVRFPPDTPIADRPKEGHHISSTQRYPAGRRDTQKDSAQLQVPRHDGRGEIFVPNSAATHRVHFMPRRHQNGRQFRQPDNLLHTDYRMASEKQGLRLPHSHFGSKDDSRPYIE